jgi:PAS domain S-box-containing protein
LILDNARERSRRSALGGPTSIGAELSSKLRLRIRLHDRRFWEVQALIGAVTIIHILFEHFEPGVLGAAYFVPASLYLFPVLYASFNFGLEGALPTAIWSAALSVPDIVVNHEGMTRFGESFQVGIIAVLATLIAVRVDKETMARRQSERSERERGLSEMKYRSLFENAGEAILVVDRDGAVREANAAADGLGMDLEHRGPSIAEQLGPDAEEIRRVLAGEIQEVSDFCVRRPDGAEAWLQPIFTAIPESDQPGLTQVLLRDVTDRHGFQHYAQEIVRAQEDERQRIAQELHDVSVQSAILICRRLDAASEAVDSGDPEAVTRTIAEARHAAEGMADELRRFSRDLRPLILEDLGLVPALKRLITELRERSQLQVRFEVHGESRRLDPRAELVLFRIGQEALRNVENHAGATRVSLRLSFDKDAARLSVVDNGVGFAVPPLTTLVNAGSLGLLGMQERARLVEGHCHIRSKPGDGTHVTAEIPGAGPKENGAQPAAKAKVSG